RSPLPRCVAHYLSLFLLLIPPPPTSTLFPTRRSSDLTDPNTPPPEAQQAPADPTPTPASDPTDPFAAGVEEARAQEVGAAAPAQDRKSTRLYSSHVKISYAVFCLKKKKTRMTLRSLDT